MNIKSINFNYDKIYNGLISWGITLLAISITFSITLMNISFGLLFIALLLQIIYKKVKFQSTGLEIPLVIFLSLSVLSAVLGPAPLKSIKDISDNFWYILHMYLVIYLFGSKEIDKFVKILGWSTIAISIYTILQSTIGLTFNLEFNLGETIKMVAPKLEKVTECAGMSIFMGTGIMGHHLTFGGQIMMLTFFSYIAFGKRKLITLLVAMALFFSFAFSAWFGFVISVMLYLFSSKKRRVYAVSIVALFILLLTIVPGSLNRVEIKLRDRIHIWKTSLKIYSMHPIMGVGPGQYTRIFDEEYLEKFPGASPAGARCHSHSVYLDVLTEGGLLAFLAFIFFLWKFVKLYAIPPVTGKWIELYKACFYALAAVMVASIFQAYLTDAENSVLIWTLAGLLIRIKKIEYENNKFNIIHGT